MRSVPAFATQLTRATERTRRGNGGSPNAMVMHPGPINRGVEMSSSMVDGDQSWILKQVENGVAVRMSMLYHVCGGELE